MWLSKSFAVFAGGVLSAALLAATIAPSPAIAGKCVRAGGQGSNVLPDVAKFMADAALPAPGATVWLEVVSPHTCYYRNEELMA